MQQISTSTAHSFTRTNSTDVVLRSADDIDFYAHKIILSIASPFFQSMFSLPSTGESSEIVPFSESSTVVEGILRLIYPTDDPTLKDLGDVVVMLEASIKYDLTEAVRVLKKALRGYIVSQSLDVFVAACRLHLEDVAGDAATAWREECHKRGLVSTAASSPSTEWEKTIEGATYSPTMDRIYAGALYRLSRHIRDPPNQLPLTFIHPFPFTPTGFVPRPVTNSYTYEDADMILKSSDDVEFRVHKRIIYLASVNHLGGAPTESGALPTVVLQESSTVIHRLLQLCYPNEDAGVLDLSTACRVIGAAIKYEMPKVITQLRRDLVNHEKTDPVGTFFAAVKLGWKEAALKAAKLVADMTEPQVVYSREMETTPAIYYYRLLRYCHQCRSAKARIHQKYITKENTSIRRYVQKRDLQDWSVSWHHSLQHSIAFPLMIRELRRPDDAYGYGFLSHTSWEDRFARLAEENKTMFREIEDSISEASRRTYQWIAKSRTS